MREALGCAPLPVYREPAHSPAGDSELARDYPLVLITGSRFMPMYHSEQRQSIEGAPSACLASAWFWRRSRADTARFGLGDESSSHFRKYREDEYPPAAAGTGVCRRRHPPSRP